MKRFWREVRVVAEASGHRVELDHRTVKTPGRRPLRPPTARLAEAIAAEWRCQDEEVDPRAMPLTRLASTVVDRMPQLRRQALDELLGFGRTDLVCYRAAHPPELVRRQETWWNPVVAWLDERLQAPLVVTRDIAPVEQPSESLHRLHERLERLDDWELVGLHALVQPIGSLVLGLAVLERHLPCDAAFEASLVDERFEIERWGWDAEAERRHRALRAEVDAAWTFLEALRSPPPG